MEKLMDEAFASLVWPDAPAESRALLRELMAASCQGHLCLRSDHPFPKEKIQGPIVRDANRYYLQRNWVLETAIVDHFRRLLQTPPLDLIEAKNIDFSPQLTASQAEVIRMAIERSLTIVSGGPGTGKTFTAGQLIQSMVRSLRPNIPALRVKIAAPTGKAADRLAQTISIRERLDLEALTLHRLLHLRPGRCRLFEERQIEADLIIVDEASMIDASLLAHLLSAILPGTRLVLLGDADQLPPIDGGGFFADIAERFSVHLDHCHRSSEATLHHYFEAVRTGDVKQLYTLLEPMPSDLIAYIEPMLGSLIFDQQPDAAELLQRLDRLRILCPLRQGPLGVDAINAALFERLRQDVSWGQWWAAPLLVTSNDAQLQLYNGTPGLVMGHYQGGSLLHGAQAVFAGNRCIPLHRLPSFELAFALSVHKSQGSEFEEVVCCLPSGSEEFGREALYTALTRAKRSVRLVGQRETLEKMIAIRSRQENGFRERIDFAF